MPTTYSTSLKLALMGNGENVGTWGTLTNTNLGTLLEQAITGVKAITMADADYTLSNSDGVPNEARNAALYVTGSNTAIRSIIIPSAPKIYIVTNVTGGGFAIRIRTATGSATTVAAGASVCVWCDGSSTVQVLNNVQVAAGDNITATQAGNVATVAVSATPSFTTTNTDTLNADTLTAAVLAIMSGASSNAAAAANTLRLRGGQIGFPVTQVPSTNLNTLDDYQEGTFTPVLTTTSGALGTHSASSNYTKIGNQVTLHFRITITNNGSGAGALKITLPYTSTSYSCGIAKNATTNNAACVLELAASTATLYCYTYAGTYPCISGTILFGSIIYTAA